MKPPFRAARTEVRLGADGRAYLETSSQERQYLETAPTTSAVHGNPGFEDETAGVPDVWDFVWQTGATEVESESAIVYSGERSLRVHLEAGGGEQIVMSDTFDVLGNDRVDFSAFAVATQGDPRIQLGLVTKATGTPTFFDGLSQSNENSPAGVDVAWAMYQRQAVVAGGHTKARLFYRISSSAGEACTVYLDLTASSVSAGAVFDSGWIALPYAANWADAGFGWQPGEYRRVGDDVLLRGLAARSTSASGATATIATLPEGFRPLASNPIGHAYYPAAGGTASTQLYVTSAGAVVTSVSVPAGDFVPFDAEVSLL